MNSPQKKLVGKWILLTFAICLFFVIDGWVLASWDVLKWPILIVIVLLAAAQHDPQSVEKGRFEMNRVVTKHPWIKVYFLIYLITLAIGIYYILSNDIFLPNIIGVAEIMAIVFLLLLPIFIIQQVEAFRNAGKKI